MAKKYLGLEEAARELGMAPDELVRLRERGEIRGFADRGTWKFKSEDVEEFARSRQADSSPEVPMLDDTPSGKTPPDVEVRRGSGSGRLNKTSDSDVRLLLDETLVPGGKDSDPEVVLSQLGTSDSDVRLTEDVGGLVDSGSDSDVKLISTSSDSIASVSGKGSSVEGSSDSDVKLIAADSDSDVRLSKPAPGSVDQSDSDVRLVGTDDLATLGSESDIRLATSEGSSMELGGDASSDSSGSSSNIQSTAAMKLGDGSSQSDESSVLLGSDSGIALDTGSAMKVGGGSSADSGITLQSLADSGISLERVDSGISLAGPLDSGIALDADSGIALEKKGKKKKEDSGITLEKKKGKKKEESGIALDDSGIRLADSGTRRGDKKKDRTAPMMKLPADDDKDSTQVEVPTFDDEDDESYKLHDDRPKTKVVLFADDEDEETPAAPPAKGKKGRADDSFALAESGVEFAEAEDFSDDEDLEVAEDVLSEESELDEIDVFEPAEEDFDSSVQSGESHSEFSAPAIAMRPAPVEVPYDGLTFAGLALSAVFLLLAGTMMFDLLRTIWFWDQNVIVGDALLNWVRGLF